MSNVSRFEGPTHGAEYEKLQAQGFSGRAAEFLTSLSAPARHRARTRVAEQVAREWVSAIVGTVGHWLLAVAALLDAELFGLRGRRGQREEPETRRHPAFEGCGTGRRKSANGPAWDAAIKAARERFGPIQWQADGGRLYACRGSARIEMTRALLPMLWARATAMRALQALARDQARGEFVGSPEQWGELFNELAVEEDAEQFWRHLGGSIQNFQAAEVLNGIYGPVGVYREHYPRFLAHIQRLAETRPITLPETREGWWDSQESERVISRRVLSADDRIVVVVDQVQNAYELYSQGLVRFVHAPVPQPGTGGSSILDQIEEYAMPGRIAVHYTGGSMILPEKGESQAEREAHIAAEDAARAAEAAAADEAARLTRAKRPQRRSEK